jgi:DNA-binding MarR family transcriptional regulator
MTEHELAEALLHKFVRSMRMIHARKVSDMSRGELFVLQLLAERREVQPADICAGMGVSTARVATLLNGMERKGWVRRLPDPADRRKIRIAITEAGDNRAFEHRRNMIDRVSRLLRELGEPDALALLRIMDRLIGIMEREFAREHHEGERPAGQEDASANPSHRDGEGGPDGNGGNGKPGE